MFKRRKRILNLHLFDGTGSEGGATADTSLANSTSGEETKKVEYGKASTDDSQSTTTQDPQVGVATGNAESGDTDLDVKFKELIRGEYKDQFQKVFNEGLERRFKNQNQVNEELEQVRNITDPLFSIFGIEQGDYESLNDAMMSNDELFGAAADNAGMTVEQYKEFLNMSMENQRLNDANEQYIANQRTQQIYQELVQEGNELQKLYPNFDLETECENPKFMDLVNGGWNIKDAYEATHVQEIMANTAQTVGQAVRKNVTDTIRANGTRPPEGGMQQQPGIVRKTDPSKLTKKDIEEIYKRAKAGEKISF